MKAAISILPLVALASAFVVPDEHVFAQIPIEENKPEEGRLSVKAPFLDKIRQGVDEAHHSLPHSLDDFFDRAQQIKDDITDQASAIDYTSWIEDGLKRWEAGDHKEPIHRHRHRHHASAEHEHPPNGRLSSWLWPKSGKKHHDDHGHHGHHSHNKTIYQLISGSKYTTNLTKLIDDDKDLVKLLNSTKANFTVFAPSDYAFSKLPNHGHKPSKEIIKKVLQYHVLPDIYPAFRLLFAHTAPTALISEKLGGHPQRVLVKFLGLLRGVRVNYYSKVVAPNIYAANGIIHGVNSILIPPPPVLEIITHLPGVFSTFELALHRTDLYDAFNTTGKATVGGTVFAPTNNAFKKLGPRANAFLFGRYGTKYLKALLEYHLAPARTLYSNAFYDGKKDKSAEVFAPLTTPGCHKQAKKDVETKGGYVHVDLPTKLKGKNLSIDIIRRGPFVDIKVNAFVHVAVQDGLARDGVIQTVNDILLPPKRPGEHSEEARDYWDGQEIEVEDLVERLNPYLESADDETESFADETESFVDEVKFEF